MSDLKIIGDIVKILDVQSGTSQSGKEWKKQEFVINTGGSFPKDVCFQVFGEDRVNDLTKYNKVGDRVEVSFNVSSRYWEKGDKKGYFNSIDAWRIEKVGVDATHGYPEKGEYQNLPVDEGDDSELPF